MLRFIAFLLVFSGCSTNLSVSNEKLKGLILKKFLTEEGFYSSNSIRLLYADTITIIDPKRYFVHCNVRKVNGKTIIIKTVDDFKYGTLEDMIKYRYYFTIQEVSIRINNTAKISFSKKMSNHAGFFEYKINGNKLITINQEIGQY